MPTFKTRGVCSRSITFSVTLDGLVHGVNFEGGCHGNLQGLSKMIEGCEAWEVVARLEGIRCEQKSTSCPDQLASCLREYLERYNPTAGNRQAENGTAKAS